MTDEIFNFPCDYPIKVFGKKNKEFCDVVINIISKYYGEIHPNQITTRDSKKGNYQAITINVLATNKKQIDDVNSELQNHYLVKYLL